MRKRPPSIDGLAASTLQLPPGAWPTVLDCLCARFPAITRSQWLERMAARSRRGQRGKWVTPETPYRVGLEVHYYREVPDEPPIPFDEVVLHVDADLLVADKPHFLPVTPTGVHVHETLLGRLIRRTGNHALAPLHRIDRETAGLVLFSTNPDSRARYQALFRERRIEKHYEAIAPALPGVEFPCDAIQPDGRRRTVLSHAGDRRAGEQRNQDRRHRARRCTLALCTDTDHRPQAPAARAHGRVGAPIANDAIYPSLRHRATGDYSRHCNCWPSGLRSSIHSVASSAASRAGFCLLESQPRAHSRT
jgi:tRNA pseudouridine32 synthase/23S rRNA pseudouridine746 synthase